MAIAARVYRPFDPAYADARPRGGAARLDLGRRRIPTCSSRTPRASRPAPTATPVAPTSGCGPPPSCGARPATPRFDRYFLENQAALRAAITANDPPAWPNVAPLALWAYALAPKGDAAVQAGIRSDSLAAADAIVARTAANGYRTSLVTKDYGWGSNGIAANYGLQLLVANALRKDARYVEAARDNLYYLLGRNAFSLSWLTRVGANPVRHPHHRPSAADANAEPWPGLLAGGPNMKRQDAVMAKLPELPPAKMYVDDEASYATNENAINWNAALVFALAGAVP